MKVHVFDVILKYIYSHFQHCNLKRFPISSYLWCIPCKTVILPLSVAATVLLLGHKILLTISSNKVTVVSRGMAVQGPGLVSPYTYG